MARKLSLRARSAVAVLLAALTGGGTAAAVATAATAPQLPNLSAASLAGLNAHDNPALAAAISRVLAEHAGTAQPDHQFASA
jgi:hypothetical protein